VKVLKKKPTPLVESITIPGLEDDMFKQILNELKTHAPFTFFGAVTGIIIMLFSQGLQSSVSYTVFYTLHPIHVFLSALVTASMYELHQCRNMKDKCNLWVLLIVGFIGSIGIATISDSLIPYLGELLLQMPNRGIHIGFIEKWWLVNPLALMGIAVAYFWPKTKLPHAGHVLLSTWTSLFHIMMANSVAFSMVSYIIVFVFLFLAVWLPCCLSDIAFPLLFIRESKQRNNKNGRCENIGLSRYFRKKKVLAVRKQLAAGKYNIDKKLNVALDHLLEDLLN